MFWIPTMSSLAISSSFTLFLSSFPLHFLLCLSLWVLFFSINLFSSHLENSFLPYSHQPNVFIIFSSIIKVTLSSVLFPKFTKYKLGSLPHGNREAKISTQCSLYKRNGQFNICLHQWRKYSFHQSTLRYISWLSISSNPYI